MPTFESEYQQQPPRPNRLDELAREYHERCESFDRGVCTGGIGPGGGVVPANHHESATISRNAAAVRAVLLAEAESLGYTRQEFQRAISHAARP